jgi:hypothetical protein
MKRFIILIPVYNDFESLFRLLDNIDLQIKSWNAEVSVLIVNDASSDLRPKIKSNLSNIKSISIINMKNNQGHARCIASGLRFLSEKGEFDYVIIMDGDGEDRPEELNLLFNKSKENPLKTITANRIKRSEGIFFKFLYECHKILTYVFTGKLIKFGNYTCLPKDKVKKLSNEACLWNSFSGSIEKVIRDKISVPSFRGKRYFGPSKMNLLNLLIHSFSIISIFKKNVIFRSFFILLIYFFFIYQYLSFFILLPVFSLIIFVLAIIKISYRENINELKNALQNIKNIEIIKSNQ